MKTMKKKDSIIRVKEKEVNKHLAEGYKYCPKQEFKTKERK